MVTKHITYSMLLYALKQSEMMVVTGLIHFFISLMRVSADRFSTGIKKHLPDSRSTPPRRFTPHWPSL